MQWFLLHLMVLAAQAFPAVVIWHGMGDTCCQASMKLIQQEIENQIEHVYVYSVRVGQDETEDRQRGFLDNLWNQIPQVCDAIRKDPQLSDGFDAIGFSQGGLFLRAYVELCVPKGAPPVKTLMTFGSPHSGVADIPQCRDHQDATCKLVRYLVSKGAYLPSIQQQVVQAQYFKDPHNMDGYLSSNIFLPYINNEIHVQSDYAQGLKTLQKWVLVRFEQDDMVVPRDSAWFDFIDQNGHPILLKEQDIYIKDTLGLKSLDEGGKLVFETLPGKHMQIDLDLFAKLVGKYLIQPNPEL